MMRTLTVLVLCTAVAGAAWVSIGPDGGYVQALGIDPQQAEMLYAVSYDYPENARLFRSTDAGASWAFVSRIPYYSVSFLAVDPFDQDRLYASARSTVIYCSEDRGETWTAYAMPGYAQAMDFDAQVPGQVYGGGYYNSGGTYKAALYVSTDYGVNWTVSMPRPDTVFYAYACAADPAQAGTAYLGCNLGYVYRTTDAGTSWTLANQGIPSSVSVQGLSVNSDGSAVVAATSSGIFRSTDDGVSWTLSTGSPASAVTVRFSGGDGNRAWALGRADSQRVYVSTDAGASWQLPVPGYTTAKTASLVPDPETGTQAYVNTQNGIFRSTDMGNNWNVAHTGLRIAKISTISAGPRSSERLYLEVSENGVFKSSDRGSNWTRCNDFLSCGNICGIGVQFGSYTDILYALEGAG